MKPTVDINRKLCWALNGAAAEAFVKGGTSQTGKEPAHAQMHTHETSMCLEEGQAVCSHAPRETGLVDGVGDALLGVLRETATDPQQLPGGERRGQRLRLEERTRTRE